VSIHLPENDRINLLFSASREEEVALLLSHVESLTR